MPLRVEIVVAGSRFGPGWAQPKSRQARCAVDLSCCVPLLIMPSPTFVTTDRGENRMDQT